MSARTISNNGVGPDGVATVAGTGGGVHVASGTFHMNAGSISGNNRAITGGGVHVAAGTFVLRQTGAGNPTITGNSAIAATGAAGGGVWSAVAFTMNAGTIENNQVTDAAGALAGAGGGVHMNTGLLTMNGGNIQGNNRAAIGGGVHLLGASGLTIPAGSTATITGNRATTHGGGVAVNSGTFTMNAGTIGNNQVLSAAGALAGNGGGVHVNIGGTFNMSAGQINNNNRATNGGGVYLIGTSNFTMSGTALITANHATSSGGGVHRSGTGTFTMNAGTISNNRVGPADSTAASGVGGGVRLASGTFNLNAGSISGNNRAGSGGGVHLQAGTFTMGAGGGTPAITGNAATSAGGGVWSSIPFTITAGSIGDNRVGNTTLPAATMPPTGTGGGVHMAIGLLTMSGGQINNNNRAGTGGGVHLAGTSSLTISGTAAAITGNLATTSGGGVHMASTGTSTMSAGQVSNNRVGALTPVTSISGTGGGVHMQSGAFNMSGGQISTNNRAGSGGGIHLAGSSALTMNNAAATVTGNTAVDTGGGVAVTAQANFTLTSGSVTSNNTTTGAGSRGGGIFATGAGTGANSFTIGSGATISGNTAGSAVGNITGLGGGVFVDTGRTLTMNGGVIEQNIASSDPPTTSSGVHVLGTFNMQGGQIRNHTHTARAGSAGRGVFAGTAGVLNITAGEIRNNETDGDGGGIDVLDTAGIVTIGGTAIIRDNTAIGSGGGIRRAAGSLIVEGTAQIHDNTASWGVGGGITTSGALTVRGGAQIRDNNATNGNGGGILINTSTPASIYGIGAARPLITGNTAGGNGGGIHTHAAITMTNATLQDNTALGTAWGTNGNGGGIWSSITLPGTTLMLTGTIIDDNTAEGNGGGIFKSGTATLLNVSGGAITNNSADDGRGGGIYMATAATSTTTNRLTTSATTTFTGNSADDPINFSMGMGAANFTTVQWQTANSLGGVLLPTPNNQPHLLNNYDVFWEHDFQSTELFLVIEGYEFGYATLTAPDPEDGTDQIVIADEDEPEPDSIFVTPGDEVKVEVTLTGDYALFPEWFVVRVTVDDGDTPDITYLDLSETPPEYLTFPMPGSNTTVTVEIMPMDDWGFNLTHEDLHYGYHLINMFLPVEIYLGKDPANSTDPDDVYFAIFNGVGADSWDLQVRAEAYNGCDELARRLFRESDAPSTNPLPILADIDVFEQDSDNLLTIINWADTTDFDRIEVRTRPTDIPLAAEHKAELRWTVIPFFDPNP